MTVDPPPLTSDPPGAATRAAIEAETTGTPATVPISVVIPTTRSRLLRDNLLGSLRGCVPQPAEVIVVDDEGTPRADRYLADEDVVVHRLEPRGGPGKARNVGAAHAAHPILAFIDDDVLLVADLFGRMYAHFADPAVSAVTGRFSRSSFYVNFCSVYKNDYMVYICDRSPEQPRTLLTAVCAVRKTAFETAGGFDERFRGATVEDIALGGALAGVGGGLRYDPQLQVAHLKHYGFLGLLRNHFHRSADMARHLLRRGPFGALRELADSQTRLSLPWHFTLGVALAGVWLLLPVLLAVPADRLPTELTRGGLTAVAAAGLPLLIGVVNLPFLIYIARGRGLVFALRAWPMLVLELTVSVVACLWGLISVPFIRAQTR